jgi:hypothetical protein
MAERSADADGDFSGHVERTNDRDYEVEERYGSLDLVRMKSGLNKTQAIPDYGISCK